MIPQPGEFWEWKGHPHSDPFWHYRVRVDSSPNEAFSFKATLVECFRGPNESIFKDDEYIFECGGGEWTRVILSYCASCEQTHDTEDYLCVECRGKL